MYVCVRKHVCVYWPLHSINFLSLTLFLAGIISIKYNAILLKMFKVFRKFHKSNKKKRIPQVPLEPQLICHTSAAGCPSRESPAKFLGNSKGIKSIKQQRMIISTDQSKLGTCQTSSSCVSIRYVSICSKSCARVYESVQIALKSRLDRKYVVAASYTLAYTRWLPPSLSLSSSFC